LNIIIDSPLSHGLIFPPFISISPYNWHRILLLKNRNIIIILHCMVVAMYYIYTNHYLNHGLYRGCYIPPHLQFCFFLSFITNSCKGMFLCSFEALGVKCEEMGFKNPSNVFYSKAAAMSAKRSTQRILFRA
jgi:hypothetical protein